MNLKTNNYTQYYLLSFVISFVAYYFFLYFSHVAGNDYIVLQGDTMAQNIPVLKWFINSIISGESINYSWSSFLGMNSYILLANGLLFSISTPIYFLFYKCNIAVVTVFVLALKAGLAAVTFNLFVCRVWKCKGINSLIFSILYSMCAFQVAYVPNNISFEDTIFMLPLLLYLISVFIETGKYRLMCVMFLYQFWNAFDLAYIVGFFAFFYLVLYSIFIRRNTKKEFIKNIISFAGYIVLTIGISAVILYPLALFILKKYIGTSVIEDIMPHINIAELFNQIFVGQNAGIYSSAPYIYCGLLTVVLFVFYVFNKKIKREEKILFLSLLCIMVLSILIKPLYFFWHGFDYPDGFVFRFSFIISFLLCVIACRQMDYFADINIFVFWLVIILDIVFYAVVMFLQEYNIMNSNNLPKNSMLYFVINVLFLFAYGIFQTLYCKNRDNRMGLCISAVIVIVVCIETVINGYSSYHRSDNLNPENTMETYEIWNNDIRDSINRIKSSQNDFYRISCLQEYAIYGAQYFDYKGISGFSTFKNNQISDFLQKIGVYTSPRLILCNGLTDFSKMILAVKYDFDGPDFGLKTVYTNDNKPEISIEENKYCLSLGFLVNDDILNFDFQGGNAFDNINQLASVMTGNQYEIYELLGDSLNYEEMGVYLYIDENGDYKLKYIDDGKGYGLIIFKIPADERQAFVQFNYGISTNNKLAPYVTNISAEKINDRDRLSVSSIYQMEKGEDNNSIVICMNGSTFDEVYVPEMNFAYYNNEEFIELYRELSQNQLKIKDVHNDYIEGTIDVTEEGKVLFTSIPYDEGWEIIINGKKTEPISLLNDSFLGIKLQTGTYDIEFKYHVSGLTTGGVISMISLFTMIGLSISRVKIRKGKNEKKSIKSI